MATLSVYSLPEFLFSRLNTDRISIREATDGAFILKPIKKIDQSFSSLRGILSGGKQMSVESHLQRMRDDLKLELELEN